MEEVKKSHCWAGLHSYVIHKEVDLTDIKNAVIGIVIINRCTNCGKINDKKIKTVEHGHN